MRVASGKSRQAPALALAALLVSAAVPAPGSACGYHDNVTLARGALNWSYPNALYVIGAISAAVSERRLPPPSRAGPDLLGSDYRRTAAWLEQIAQEMRTAPNPAFLSVSIVLIEPMLWTLFEIDQGGVRSSIHLTGPKTGALVLVTGESAIQEIANGRLSIGEAQTMGVIRLYGAEDQFARFLAAYSGIGGGARTGKAAQR